MSKYSFNRLEELYILAKQFGIDTKQPASKMLRDLDILNCMIWDHWMFNDPNETEIENFINSHFTLKLFRTAFSEVLSNILADIDKGYKQFQLGLTTYEDAISIAGLYGLAEEVKECMQAGMSASEALREWDLL